MESKDGKVLQQFLVNLTGVPSDLIGMAMFALNP